MRNCRRTQCQTFYHCSAFEANWKGEKAPLVSEYFMSWLQIKKIFVFKCCLLLLLHNNKESFLDRIVMIDEKWILFDNWWWPAQWLDQEAAPKHFPKPSCTPPKKKKVTVTVGWSAPSLIHYSLLNPIETISFEKHAQQIDAMYQKLQCLQPVLVNRMGPILFHDNINCMSYNQHFKSWTNCAMKFCLIHRIHLISHQLTTTFSTILTTFCMENASITSRRQKMLSKSSLNPKAQIFTL